MRIVKWVAGIIVICSVFAYSAWSNNWTVTQFYTELDRFENQRGAFLTEEQVLRVARILNGCTDSDIRSLSAIQRPKNQLSAFGRTSPANPGECRQYPQNSWARVICDGALGIISAPPGGKSEGPKADPATFNFDRFLKEKEAFEKRRQGFLPVGQALQAAKYFPGWDQDKLRTLELGQRAYTYQWTGSGQTIPVNQAECMRYPEGSWSRVIAEAALGIRPQVQAGLAAPEEPPKLWPKPSQWVKEALSPKKTVKIEPEWKMPPRDRAVYFFICQERPHLYWVSPGSGLARLTKKGIFRSPLSICLGPNNTFYVMDMPTYKKDNSIMWQIDPSGNARVVLQLDPEARETHDFDRADQMIYDGDRIYVSGAIRGIFSILPEGRVEPLLKIDELKNKRWRVGFGGVAIRGGQLLLAHGYACIVKQKSTSPINFDYRLAAGALRNFSFRNRTVSTLATDQQAGLFSPHSIAITPDGTIYITDRGLAIGELACLQRVQGNSIMPLKIKIGNRGLRRPCGMIGDNDGSIIIADPYMWSPEGESGAIIRFVPATNQSTYLFLGRGNYHPLGVVRWIH